MDRQSVSDQMRAWLKDLVQVESPSGDVAGIEEVMAIIQGGLGMAGTVQVTSTPKGPIWEMKRGQGGALLLGHADTVWPKGTIDEMPWRDDGERVYGPGVLDMKAGLVLAMAAIRSLPEETPFHLVVTPDEEVGSDESRTRIEEVAKQADLVLVLESGTSGGGIKIGRSGVGNFFLEVHGVESHAGLEPDNGASAIRELAQQILWLDGLEQKTMGTTVNVGVVEGGTRPNVVAGKASLLLDVRVSTASEMDRVTATLHAPPRFDFRCEVQYQGGFSRPPMEPNETSEPWVVKAGEIWKNLTGTNLSGARVGGASDGNFTAPIAPTLDGLGAIGQGAHARNETVEWEYMMPRYDLVRALILQAGTEEA